MNEVFEEKTVDDIYYNKQKYDAGEINLLFITGYSGSGKSSMAQTFTTTEVVDMDKVIMPSDKPDEYYKDLGGFADEFMNKGPGRKYRELPAEDHITDKYRSNISKDAISYAMKYASSHKNTRVIVEGVWLYRYVDPATVDKHAVFIKGTGLATSATRAIKRDLTNAKGEKKVYGRSKPTFVISKVKQAIVDGINRGLKKWIDYYRPKYQKQLKTVTEDVSFDMDLSVEEFVDSYLENTMTDILLKVYESVDLGIITKEEAIYLKEFIK